MAGPSLRDGFYADPYLTQGQTDALEASALGPVAKGYQSGRLSNEANYQLSQQMALREANNEAAAAALQPKINALRQRASIYAPSVQKVEDINGVGSGLTWLGGQVGQGAASMQDPMLASAALTGVGTGLSFMPNPIAKGAGFLLRNVAAPGVAYGINREQLKGEQYGNLSEDPAVMASHTPQEIASQVGDYANVAGLLDTAVPGLIGRKLGGGALRGAVSKFSPLTHTVSELGMEGLTELAQGEMARQQHTGLNPLRDTSGDWSDRLNDFAGAAGAAGPAMAGGAADAGFRGIRRGAEGVGQVGKAVTDAAGKTIDMLAPKAEPYISKAAEGLRQAKEMATGKVVDLKGQFQQMSQNRAEAHAEDELIAGTPPPGMDVNGPEFVLWALKRQEAISDRLDRMAAKGDQKAAELRQGIDESFAKAEEAAQYILRQGRLEEVLADTKGVAKGLGARLKGLAVDGVAKVAGAVENALGGRRKQNAQTPEYAPWTGDEYERRKGEAVASLGDLMATHMSQEAQAEPLVQGLSQDKQERLGGHMQQLGRQLADIAHNWTPPGTKKPSVQQFDRMQNDLSRIARTMVSVYGERAPDVAERLQSFADPKTKAVFGHLQDAISKDSVSRGSVTETKAWQVLKSSIPTEKQAELARDGIDLTAPDVRRGMMAMIEAAANGQLTPQARRQLSGLIGADGLQKVVEAYHPVPDAAKRLDEAWSTAEEGPEDKTPTTSDEDTTSNEGSDFEKRQGEKALAKRGNERVYGLLGMTPMSDTMLAGGRRDPMTFSGTHRPRLYDLRTTAEQDPRATPEELAGRQAQLAKDTERMQQHVGASGETDWGVSTRSALDELAGRMSVDPKKALSALDDEGGRGSIDPQFAEAMLRQYRDHMRDLHRRAANSNDPTFQGQAKGFEARAENADLVLKDRAAMRRFAEDDVMINQRAAQTARARVEAGLPVGKFERKGLQLQTSPGDRIDMLKKARAFLSTHGVIVAERTTQRDIERITPAQVTELVNSGRALLKAHPDTLAADKEWDHERMGSQKNDVLRFRSATRVDSNGDPVLMPVRGRDLAALGRRARLQQGDERDGGNANARYLEDLASGIAALIDTGLVQGLPEGFEGGQIPKALPLDNTSFENFKFGRKTAAANAAARLAKYGDPYLGEGEDFRDSPSNQATVQIQQTKDYYTPGEGDHEGDGQDQEERLTHEPRREMYVRTTTPSGAEGSRRREFGEKKYGEALDEDGNIVPKSKGVYGQQDRYQKDASWAEVRADKREDEGKLGELTGEADEDEQTSHVIGTRATGDTAYSSRPLTADKATLDAESTMALRKRNAAAQEKYEAAIAAIKESKASPGDKAAARRLAREQYAKALVSVVDNPRSSGPAADSKWGDKRTEFRDRNKAREAELQQEALVQERGEATETRKLAIEALDTAGIVGAERTKARKSINAAHSRVMKRTGEQLAKLRIEAGASLDDSMPMKPRGMSTEVTPSPTAQDVLARLSSPDKFDQTVVSGKWKELVKGKPELLARFKARGAQRLAELRALKAAEVRMTFTQTRTLNELNKMELQAPKTEATKTEATKPAAAKEDAAPLGKSQDRRSGAGKEQARDEKRVAAAGEEMSRRITQAAQEGTISGGFLNAQADEFVRAGAYEAEVASLRQLAGELSALVAGKHNLGGTAQTTVDGWAARFAGGEKVTVARLPADSAYMKAVGAQHGEFGGAYTKIAGQHFILTGSYRDKVSSLNRLAHEFGHALQRIKFDNAPEKVQEQIRAAWERDIASDDVMRFMSPARYATDETAQLLNETPLETDKDARRVVEKGAVADAEERAENDPAFAEYFASFHEWFAEQFSKYVTHDFERNVPPAVRSFWRNLIDAFKRYFNAVIAPAEPNKDFAAWVDSLAGPQRKLNAQALQHHAESGNLGFGAAHNSPHEFDGFNWREHLGKGEGAWVFGAGTYVSTGDSTHKYYKALFTKAAREKDETSWTIDGVEGTSTFDNTDGHTHEVEKGSLSGGQRLVLDKMMGEGLSAVEAVEAAKKFGQTFLDKQAEDLMMYHGDALGKAADYLAKRQAIPTELAQGLSKLMNVERWNKNVAYAKKIDGEIAAIDPSSIEVKDMRPPPTYHVSVDIDHARMLDWDRPLNEQSKTVQLRALKVLREKGISGDLAMTGEKLYKALAKSLGEGNHSVHGQLGNRGDYVAASNYLQGLGILGTRYNSENGRNSERPNYVIYDDSKIKVNYVAFNGQNPSSNASTQAQMEEAKAYLNKILPDVHVAFKEIFGDDGTPVSGEWVKSQNTVFVSTMAGANTLSVAYHEGLHAFFSKFVENDERTKQILMSLADDKKVLARLEALLAQHPAALSQLVDGEERLAYIYQFWASGMLELPRQPRTVFEKIKRFFARVFAQITDQDRAVAILDALHTGKLGDPSVAGQVIAKAKMEGMLTTQLARKVDALVAKVQSLTVAANSMLEMSDSETARKLAMMMWTNPGNEEHGKAEQEGYLNARSAVATQYTNEFKSYLKGLNDTDLKQINEYLQQGTDASTIPFASHQEAVNKIRALNKRFYRYMTDERGMQLGKFDPDRYFPRVWDASLLVANGEDFVKMLLTHYPQHVKDEKTARALLDLLIRNSLGERVLPERMDGVLAPFFASEENRKLAWIEPHHSAEFQTKNLIHTLSTYYHNGARAAEYTHRFGQRGEKLEGMLEDVHKELVEASKKLVARQEFKTQAEADKWRQRRYEQVVKAVGAMEGTLGSDVNSTWRNASVWTTVYQNVRLLPLALFSNLVDPLALVARGGTMSDAYDTFLRGMTQVINNWKDMLSREPKERQADAWERMAEAMGTVDAAMFSHHVADEYSSMYMSTKAKAVNETFFKANGMEAWNRGVRVGATRAAVNFLTRHAKLPDVHSARWLTELGLAPSDLTFDAGGQLILDKSVLAKQKGIPIAQAEVEMEKVHAAVRRWVQGAVITPNAAQRPSWSSDPHYSMFFHLKQFSYSFHQTILKRAVKELEYGNLAPLGSFIWYVPVMMAADITRGLIQGGGQLPAYMKGMTASDWVLRSASRSGLLSVGEIGINAASDLASLGGPAVEQVIDGFGQPIGRTVVDALPASPLVKHLGGR